jgi:thiamine biosynthesis lipoprotein
LENKIKMNMKIKIIVTIILFWVSSCTNKKNEKFVYQFSFQAMGTFLSISYMSEKKDYKLEEKIKNYIKTFDEENSFYKSNSYISKANKMAFKEKVKISSPVCDIIDLSIKYGAISENKFDITYKTPLNNRGTKNIELNCKENYIKFKNESLIIDTGGIAKGYSIDKTSEILKENGYKNFLINYGGDILVCGKKSKNEPWKIGIKNPYKQGDYLKIITKENLDCYSIATSGDYERYVIKDGKKYSHIIDPKTGKSVSGAHSITVIGKNATIADTFATAISVGYKDENYIKKLIKEMNIEVYLLVGDELNLRKIEE